MFCCYFTTLNSTVKDLWSSAQLIILVYKDVFNHLVKPPVPVLLVDC